MSTSNRALEQVNAQMDSVRALVAALDVDFDRLCELREEKADYDADDNTRLCWAEEHPDEAEELLELEAAAGVCSDQDEARQRIEEDALAVAVRNDWYEPGDAEYSSPTDFQILLCTGGPTVRIMGELGQFGEPCRAWLEYQDWFTSWTERTNQPGDQDALLAYARCFYFE